MGLINQKLAGVRERENRGDGLLKLSRRAGRAPRNGHETVTRMSSSRAYYSPVMNFEADNEAVAGSAGVFGVADRQRWLAVLAKAAVAELETSLAEVGDTPVYRVLRHGETGLVMVRGRMGGSGGPFNLGEMTMTRAVVQLIDDSGEATYTGFGHVAGRSARHATLVALFDALLQDPIRHDEIADRVVKPLAMRQQAAKTAAAAKVAASKVDFFTLVRSE
jgi:alpha-D-ribose 1-methylphosphonate 5-triphosphate synthase subunit PhnG